MAKKKVRKSKAKKVVKVKVQAKAEPQPTLNPVKVADKLTERFGKIWGW